MVAARIPRWKGNLLNIAGRTALVRSTLSAIPVHTAMAVCLSQWALGRIDKIRRGFIWTGTTSASGGRCRVAWPVVCRPTDLGGLGVADLQRAGLALRLRWPWLRRTDTDRPWLGLPDKDEKASAEFFKAATVAAVGDGRSTLFWIDNWIDGSCIRSLAPAVFGAVPKRRHGVTVAEALQNSRWVHHVTGPRSVRLIAEFVNLSNIVEHTILTPGAPDTFSWRLSADQAYSASSAYGAMFIGCSRPVGARQLWKTSAPPRVRLFFWLVMHGKCWTAHRRWRHGLQDECTCVLCDQEDETMDHLLLGCVFSRQVWQLCLAAFNLQGLVVVRECRAMLWWTDSRRGLPKVLRRAFDSLFFLVGWSLWKERNARTFGGSPRSPALLLQAILDEADFWIAAGFRRLSAVCCRRSQP